MSHSGPYSISLSSVTADSIREQFQTARAEGHGRTFELALRRIRRQLTDAPLVFGEPAYSVRPIRLRVRFAMIAPVAIQYGVYRNRRIVLLRHVIYLRPGG